MSTRRYRTGVRQLAAAQKSGAGVPAYLRWVNRGLGRRAAAVAWVWGVTPNAVTLVSAALSFAGVMVLAILPMDVFSSLGASALLLAGYALDSADGQLARLTKSGSVAGEWLDHVVDAARLPIVHVAIGTMFLRAGSPPLLVGAALAFAVLASTWFFAQILAEKLSPGAANDLGSEAPPWVSFAKLPYDVGTLYIVVALAWWPLGFGAAYIGLLVITALVAFVSLRRKYVALQQFERASLPERQP